MYSIAITKAISVVQSVMFALFPNNIIFILLEKYEVGLAKRVAGNELTIEIHIQQILWNN